MCTRQSEVKKSRKYKYTKMYKTMNTDDVKSINVQKKPRGRLKVT